jgi:hypothetical protein
MILCTVCSFSELPVLTLNGLCYSVDADWNYYIHLDEANRISYYEGYKAYNIIKINNRWTIQTKSGAKTRFDIYQSSETEDRYPVGRSIWNMSVPICEINEEERQSISFSKCHFGNEFTCTSGHCIDLKKRCDNVPDCVDKSDEVGCKLIIRPDTYREIQPPEPMNRSEALPITTQVMINLLNSF